MLLSKMTAPIYDRLPNESRQAFQAFRTYLELDEDRSTAAVARKLGKTKALIDRWCSPARGHNWVERARAYDEWIEHREREAMIRERLKMRRRHAQLGLLAQKKCTEALPHLNPTEIKASGFARLLGESTRLERLALGDDSEDGGHASVTIVVNHRHPTPGDAPKTFPVSKFRGGETA